MLGAEACRLGKVERHAVGETDRHEGAPFRARLEAEYRRQEFRRSPLVGGRYDRVVEFYRHIFAAPVSRIARVQAQSGARRQ